ncbi:MAG: hypothetical protein JWO06_1645 [Bacteroidota bacterium]|nr:hypothetical protein [Bacteroidota bacterium]
MDLYRVKDLEEALALGIEEYTDGQSYCFVEWPELIENVLPRESVIVQIKPVDNMREITIFSR